VVADPNVELQDGTETHDYRAREVHGEEKAQIGGSARSPRTPTTPTTRRRPTARSPSSFLERV
jgi:hypothetical protein